MIVDARDLPAALREAAASGLRQRLIAVARGGVQRARALAARCPFVDIRIVPLDDEAIAGAVAGLVPPDHDAVLVPGEPRLARLIADRAGCRWSAGSLDHLRRHPALHPWILDGDVLRLPAVRDLVAARIPQETLRRPPAAAGPPAPGRLQPLLDRMERDLDPGFGLADGPAETIQPTTGWVGSICQDLRSAQARQRHLVAHGVIAQRHGRVLRLPAGSEPSAPDCAPAVAAPSAPLTILLRRPADAEPAALLQRITAALQAGARSVVVQPLAEDLRDQDDLSEDLRLIARRCPFLDLHLARPVGVAERAGLLAPHLTGPVRLCGSDRGGLAVLAERLGERGVEADPELAGEPLDADCWDGPGCQELLVRRGDAALADRSLMPDPWLEVAQALAMGEAHHGGQAGETVSAVGLAVGAVQLAAPGPGRMEADLAGAPVSPLVAMQVEPVAAAAAALDPVRQATVLAALDRGLRLLTGLPVVQGGTPGWIGLRVPDPVFVLRAVVVQGVLARRTGDIVWLPAGPAFTLRREVRSILTAVATAIIALGELRAQEPVSSR